MDNCRVIVNLDETHQKSFYEALRNIAAIEPSNISLIWNSNNRVIEHHFQWNTKTVTKHLSETSAIEPLNTSVKQQRDIQHHSHRNGNNSHQTPQWNISNRAIKHLTETATICCFKYHSYWNSKSRFIKHLSETAATELSNSNGDWNSATIQPSSTSLKRQQQSSNTSLKHRNNRATKYLTETAAMQLRIPH